MPDILNYAFLAVGVAIGYVLFLLDQRRLKTAGQLLTCIKKRRPVVFLETDKAVYFRTIARTYKNLAITPEKEVIIIPKASVKPCLNLNGVEMVHGDLYKSITTPREFRLIVDELKAQGLKEEDIQKFFEEVELIPPEQLKEFWKKTNVGDEFIYYKVENGQKFPISKEDYELASVDETQKKLVVKEKVRKSKEEEAREIKIDKFNIYKNLSSVVKDFIYTGINRVSIAAMIREMVYQRELEKVGGRNWIAIAIAFLVIAIAVIIILRMVVSGGLLNLIGNIASSAPAPTPPAQIAP